MDMQGKVSIVTGGAQGIGRSFCRVLLQKGMKVCMCDIKEPPSNFIENLVSDFRDNLTFKQCDVTRMNEFKDVFDYVLKKFGRIDLVVNNAGTINEHEWKRVIEVNLIGVIHGIQLGFQYMGTDNGGSGGFIVNTGSNAGLEPFAEAPIYCASKHGVIGLTKSFGMDYHFQKTGVKVAAVCPGPVDTELFHTCPQMSLYENEMKKLIARMNPVKPEDVAGALLKLLEDDRNGALLRVDDKGMRYA